MRAFVLFRQRSSALRWENAKLSAAAAVSIVAQGRGRRSRRSVLVLKADERSAGRCRKRAHAYRKGPAHFGGPTISRDRHGHLCSRAIHIRCVSKYTGPPFQTSLGCRLLLVERRQGLSVNCRNNDLRMLTAVNKITAA